jgi:hypothetical protein
MQATSAQKCQASSEPRQDIEIRRNCWTKIGPSLIIPQP